MKNQKAHDTMKNPLKLCPKLFLHHEDRAIEVGHMERECHKYMDALINHTI
jgi:hypothetical protein